MNHKQHKILLMGPQGSGKGTQAELLSEELNIPAFGMGQLLRDEIATESDLGKKFREIVTRGDLVSDEDAAEMLKRRLEKPDTHNGYILDGYPRNPQQYAAFNFDTPTHVLVIEIPKDETMKRLGGRLTCDKCGKVDSMKNGANIGDACECGGEFIQRADDKPDAIERRLKIYDQDTNPIISEYEKQNIVFRINGVGGIEEVYDRLKNVLYGSN